MSLVRAFPEASGGVAQLDLGTLPDYEVIELADLERFRAKVAKVSEIEPRGYFVGSAALRIWMDQANLPVPAEVSGDIDIALVSKKLRDSGVTHTDMDGFTLDRFGMTREDARPEHFTETLYHGNNIRIARLPRLYSYKYREHLGSPVDIGLLEIAPD
ncbi:MAG TPA: hypothetical protein VFB03_01660, partial [Candidatus Saccharimonadales bacterium]|nr:hypothetical protein [Candidatus Saccharimonadales bacterium]